MARLPDAAEQVLKVHGALIRAVVLAMLDRSRLAAIEPMLAEAETRGWSRLVMAIRQVADGRRDRSILLGLDDEDRVIVEAILAGIENPATLPPVDVQPEGSAAAPGLAAMISAAGRGDVKAFSALANMAEQMLKAGGDMARLGGIMRRMVDGERDVDVLARGMGALGRQLVIAIVDELARETLH